MNKFITWYLKKMIALCNWSLNRADKCGVDDTAEIEGFKCKFEAGLEKYSK
jgi:hypothetical protein